jgi:ribosomal subunit interface protein
MHKRPEINFKGFDHSDAVEAAVQKRIQRLSERYADIIGCTVTLDEPHQSGTKGNIFSVSIDLTVPGEELVVSRDPQKDHSHEDIYVAIRDAFDAMERQLEKHFAKQRPQDTKSHS